MRSAAAAAAAAPRGEWVTAQRLRVSPDGQRLPFSTAGAGSALQRAVQGQPNFRGGGRETRGEFCAAGWTTRLPPLAGSEGDPCWAPQPLRLAPRLGGLEGKPPGRERRRRRKGGPPEPAACGTPTRSPSPKSPPSRLSTAAACPRTCAPRCLCRAPCWSPPSWVWCSIKPRYPPPPRSPFSCPQSTSFLPTPRDSLGWGIWQAGFLVGSRTG